MVLLEFMLLSLVAGTILGISWRLFDDWCERSHAEAVRKTLQEATDPSKQD
jgi:hypothetical protein